jgi:hypothetical protein
MTAKNVARFRWGLLLWVLFWVLAFPRAATLDWKAVWVRLAIIYGGAYYLLSRSDTQTERGLQKASSILIGLVGVQIAVAIFMAFEAAKK